MGITLRQVFVQVLCFFPIVVVMGVIVLKRRAERAQSKAPFTEMNHRPAGESLRLKLESFDEKLFDWTFFLVAFPVAFGLLLSPTKLPGIALPAIGVAICTAWASVCGWRLYTLSRQRANYQLGFDGERFVGEELSRLVADGFEIYHDVPFDGFNIDHVIVGPPGVFAIETKTRRKPFSESQGKEYRVEFDGFQLHWPMGKDGYGIRQAEDNARTLSQWLTGAVGEPIPVIPILTLPGWMVDRKAPTKAVTVVNPKEIRKACNSNRALLDDTLVRRICYQLEQKCRLSFE